MSPGPPAEGSFVLTDTPGRLVPSGVTAGSPAGIPFKSTGREAARYLVQGGACPQRRGFDGGPVYLRHDLAWHVTLTLQRSLEPPGS